MGKKNCKYDDTINIKYSRQSWFNVQGIILLCSRILGIYPVTTSLDLKTWQIDPLAVLTCLQSTIMISHYFFYILTKFCMYLTAASRKQMFWGNVYLAFREKKLETLISTTSNRLKIQLLSWFKGIDNDILLLL